MSKGLRVVLALVIIGGIVAVLAFAAASLKADQDAAVAKYGAEAIGLCKNAVDSSVTGDLPSSAKLVFIDSNLSTIHYEYQPKLVKDAANRAADDKTTLTHVACTKQVEVLFDTDSYGATGKYVCKRYARHMEVALFEVKTGKQVGYWKVKGATPPECPEKTDKDVSKYGNPPISTDIFGALGI